MMETWLPYKLRTLRVRQGLTLVEAAKKTGVTRATLSELERGHRHPVAPTLVKIAKGYGVPVEELLEEPVPLAEVPERGFDFEEILRTNHMPEDLTLEDLGELRKALAREISKPREEWRGQPVTLYFLAGLGIAMRGGKKVDELEVLKQNLKQVQELVGAAS